MSVTKMPASWRLWFPKEMLNLPQPWRELEDDYEWLATIPYTREEMLKALDVLERGFRVLPKLPHPPLESLPEEFSEFPGMAIGSITLTISTFDDFRANVFVERFNRHYPNCTLEDVERLAQIWTHREVDTLVARVHNWIFETLHEMRDPELVTSYISLARNVWKTLPRETVRRLITRSYRPALDTGVPQVAIRFLDEVLAAPNIDPEDRAWANKLRQELQAASVADRR